MPTNDAPVSGQSSQNSGAPDGDPPFGLVGDRRPHISSSRDEDRWEEAPVDPSAVTRQTGGGKTHAMQPFTTGWMQTYVGKRFYPGDPGSTSIDPRDIAHALSLLCRYGGHVDRFYSVAEHCVLMSQAVPPSDALAALLHDATEAYVVDVPRPLKQFLGGYKKIEDGVWIAVANRFGLYYELPESVLDADDRILIDEKTELMPRAERWTLEDEVSPLGISITGWSPAEAEDQYTGRLLDLWRG
jgi:uncharacterized protein